MFHNNPLNEGMEFIVSADLVKQIPRGGWSIKAQSYECIVSLEIGISNAIFIHYKISLLHFFQRN